MIKRQLPGISFGLLLKSNRDESSPSSLPQMTPIRVACASDGVDILACRTFLRATERDLTWAVKSRR